MGIEINAGDKILSGIDEQRGINCRCCIDGDNIRRQYWYILDIHEVQIGYLNPEGYLKAEGGRRDSVNYLSQYYNEVSDRRSRPNRYINRVHRFECRLCGDEIKSDDIRFDRFIEVMKDYFRRRFGGLLDERD